jgi:hypothetical protein
MDTEVIENGFPKLRGGGYRLTSPEDGNYNCIAWALNCETLVFQYVPYPSKANYWPPGILRDDTLESWMEVFRLHGYEPCGSAALEAGIEKIAIYLGDDGVPTHVAKQTLDGKWSSKLGIREYDIEHESLGLLEGTDADEDGKVGQIMKNSSAQ